MHLNSDPVPPIATPYHKPTTGRWGTTEHRGSLSRIFFFSPTKILVKNGRSSRSSQIVGIFPLWPSIPALLQPRQCTTGSNRTRRVATVGQGCALQCRAQQGRGPKYPPPKYQPGHSPAFFCSSLANHPHHRNADLFIIMLKLEYKQAKKPTNRTQANLFFLCSCRPKALSNMT